MQKTLSAIGLALSVLSLSGCGVTYTSPTVRSQADDARVRVVPLNAETVLVANRQSYSPRSLPEVFYATAGGGNLRGAGALPEEPYVPTASREPLELRLPPPAQAEPYRIGVGDVVLLAVKGSASTIEELSGLITLQSQRRGFTVRDDGTIAIPDVGTVRLANMTVEEAEAEVFRALVANQIDPAFSLEIAEFNSKRIAVGGAVGEGALVPVTLNTPDLGEALAAAGGITVRDEEFASIRLYRDGTLYQIPLNAFYDRPELQKTRLQAGDAIYVDTTYDLDRALEFYQQKIDIIGLRRGARTQALQELQTEIGIRRAALQDVRGNFEARVALDAEPRDYVYLSGEVASQSRFTLPYGRHSSLADVLYDNGGFQTETGDPSHIYVLRSSPNPSEFGAVTAWHLDASNAANITLATRLEMRPNDVVFIQEQPITRWNRALRQFFPPLISAATRG